MSRKGLILLFAAMALTALASATALAQYSDELEVSTTDPNPGGEVVVSGDGFAPGSTVRITMEPTSAVLATTTADDDGAFRVTVTIPSGTDPGTYTLKARGEAPGGDALVLGIRITVGGSLSRTGQGVLAIAGVAVALTVLGVAIGRTARAR